MFLNQSTCDTAAKLAGKTISRVEYGYSEGNPLSHQGQMFIFYFTDGTKMSLFTGTNIGNFWEEPSDLRVDLTAMYHEAGEQPLRPEASRRFPAEPGNGTKLAEAV